jgi:hypothetical protein
MFGWEVSILLGPEVLGLLYYGSQVPGPLTQILLHPDYAEHPVVRDITLLRRGTNLARSGGTEGPEDELSPNND